MKTVTRDVVDSLLAQSRQSASAMTRLAGVPIPSVGKELRCYPSVMRQVRLSPCQKLDILDRSETHVTPRTEQAPDSHRCVVVVDHWPPEGSIADSAPSTLCLNERHDIVRCHVESAGEFSGIAAASVRHPPRSLQPAATLLAPCAVSIPRCVRSGKRRNRFAFSARQAGLGRRLDFRHLPHMLLRYLRASGATGLTPARNPQPIARVWLEVTQQFLHATFRADFHVGLRSVVLIV